MEYEILISCNKLVGIMNFFYHSVLRKFPILLEFIASNVFYFILSYFSDNALSFLNLVRFDSVHYLYEA